MDAVKYLKEYERMCRSFKKSCEGCGIHELKVGDEGCQSVIKRHPEEVVAIIERWSAEHPEKTRQSELLKLFPNAKMAYGIIDICPEYIDKNFECRSNCLKCKKKYWLEEVE